MQTFQNHLQTLEFEDLGDRTKLTQTMRFATTEERDTTMQYGVEEGAKGGFARVDALLQRLPLDARALPRRRSRATARRAWRRGRRHGRVPCPPPRHRAGKSALVLGTIAAESQRLINETCSAFVQAFTPTRQRQAGDSRLNREAL